MTVFYRLVIAKFYYESNSDEDFKKNLKALGLEVPAPRNWSGTDKVSCWVYYHFTSVFCNVYATRIRQKQFTSPYRLQHTIIIA